jgi:hypothetical protein
MKTLKILAFFIAFTACFSCGDEEKINKFEALLGSWQGGGSSGEITGGYFAIDSLNWIPYLEFLSDSACYYSEYNVQLDSVANSDTGSFYIAKDSLYITGISPVMVGFNNPIRGKLAINGDNFQFYYKLVNSKTGAVAKIERMFSKL